MKALCIYDRRLGREVIRRDHTWLELQRKRLDTSMPGYIDKVRQRFKHEMPKGPQHSPYWAAPRIYRKSAQHTIPDNESLILDDKCKQSVQQVIGSILYYGRAIDETTLTALRSIASEQSRAMEMREVKCMQPLDYLATHLDTTIRSRASAMVLNIHSNASYFSESRAHSHLAGCFFLRDMPEDGKPIFLNGAIHVMCRILKTVVASAA